MENIYFLEFDVLDTATERFLTTPDRRSLLHGLPIFSVPVLHVGPIASPAALKRLIGPTGLKTPNWRDRIAEATCIESHRHELVERQTDPSPAMEGLYIKIEEDGTVVDRFKYVRHDFLTAVIDSESHWLSRPILPNGLLRNQ